MRPKYRASDLRAFYDFVGEKLRLSESRLTPESVFDEWQSLHPANNQDEFIDDQDDCEAIKESLDAMHAGEPAKSLEQFERDVPRTSRTVAAIMTYQVGLQDRAESDLNRIELICDDVRDRRLVREVGLPRC